PRAHRQYLNRNAAVAGVAVFFYGLSLFFGYHLFRMREEKRQQISTLTSNRDALRARLQAFESQKAKDSKGGPSPQSFLKNRVLWAEPLRELSRLTPRHLWLTSLTGELKNGAVHLTLSGQALHAGLITDFSAAIEQSYHFRGVKLKLSERDETV